MPMLGPTVERFDQPIWSGWIADNRPGGFGIEQHGEFKQTMRLFVNPIAPKKRTNMPCSSILISDRTGRFNALDFHVSFDSLEAYEEFFRSCEISLYVGDRKFYDFSMSDVPIPEGWERQPDGSPKPTYDLGYTGTIDFEKPIHIEQRQDFHLELRSSEAFARMMKEVEHEWVPGSFAEITFFLKAIHAREIL